MTSPDQWNRTIFAGLFVGAALIAEHALLYDEQAMKDEPELTLFASNVLGTITIAAGVLIAADDSAESARHITIAAIGGAAVVAVRIARRLIRLDRELQALAHDGLGQIRGARNYGRSYDGAAGAAGRN